MKRKHISAALIITAILVFSPTGAHAQTWKADGSPISCDAKQFEIRCQATGAGTLQLTLTNLDPRNDATVTINDNHGGTCGSAGLVHSESVTVPANQSIKFQALAAGSGVNCRVLTITCDCISVCKSLSGSLQMFKGNEQ